MVTGSQGWGLGEGAGEGRGWRETVYFWPAGGDRRLIGVENYHAQTVQLCDWVSLLMTANVSKH